MHAFPNSVSAAPTSFRGGVRAATEGHQATLTSIDFGLGFSALIRKHIDLFRERIIKR